MNIDFLKIEMHTTHLENGTSGLSSDLEGKGGARQEMKGVHGGVGLGQAVVSLACPLVTLTCGGLLFI